MERPLLLENLPQVTFDDAAIYFSEEQWQNLEDFQKKIYKELIKEIYETMVALGYRIPKPDIVSRIERGEEPCVCDGTKKAKPEAPQAEGSKDAEPVVKVERESPEASAQIPPSEISSSQERQGVPPCPRCGMHCNNQCGMGFQWNVQGGYPGPPMDANHRKPYMPPSPTFYNGVPVSPGYNNRGEGMPHPTSPMAGYGNTGMVPLSPHYPGYRDPNTTFPFPERPANPAMFGGFEVNQPTAMGPPASHMPAPDHDPRGRKEAYLQAREAALQERRSQAAPCPNCGGFCNNQCGANAQWEQRRLHHPAAPGQMEANRYPAPPNPYFNNGPNPSAFPNVRPPLRHGTPPANLQGNPPMMQFSPQFPGYRRPGDQQSPNVLHGKPELSPGQGFHGANSSAGSPQGLNQPGKYGGIAANSGGNQRKPQSMSPLSSENTSTVSAKNLNGVPRPPGQTVTSSDLSRGPPQNTYRKPDNVQQAAPGAKTVKVLGTATPPVGNNGQSVARNTQASSMQSQNAGRVTTGEGFGVKRPAPQQPSESRPPLKKASPVIVIVDGDDEKPASTAASGGNRQNSSGTPIVTGGSRQSSAGTATANGGTRQNSAGTPTAIGGSRQSSLTPTANGGYRQSPTGTPTSSGGYRQSPTGTPTSGGGYRQSPTGTPTASGGYRQSPNGTSTSSGGYRQSPTGTPTASGGYRQSATGTSTASGGYRQSPAGTPTAIGGSSQGTASSLTGKRTPTAEGGNRQSGASTLSAKSRISSSEPIVVEDCDDFTKTSNQDGRCSTPPITISNIRTAGIFTPPMGKGNTSCPIIIIDDKDIDGVIVQTEQNETSIIDTPPKLAIEPAPPPPPPPPPVTKVQTQVAPQEAPVSGNKMQLQSPILVSGTGPGNQTVPVSGNQGIMLTFPVSVGNSGLVLATQMSIPDKQTNKVPINKNPPRFLQPNSVPVNVTSGNANPKLGPMTIRPVMNQPTGITLSGQAKPINLNQPGPFNINNTNLQRVNGGTFTAVPVTSAGGQSAGQPIPIFVDPKSGLILTGTAVPSTAVPSTGVQNATVVTVNGGMVTGNVASLAMGGGLVTGNIGPVAMGGGLVTGNVVPVTMGGGVVTGNIAPVTMGGGVVTGNVAMGGNLSIGNIAPVNVNGLGTTFFAVDRPIGNNPSVTLGSTAPLNMNNPTILALNRGLPVGGSQPVGGPITNITSVPAVVNGQQNCGPQNGHIIIRKVGEPGMVPQNSTPSQHPPASDDLSMVVVERLFNCSECGDKFNSLENLTSHQESHKRPVATLDGKAGEASKDSGNKDGLPGGADDDSPTILYTTQGDDGSTVYVVTV